MPDSTKWKSACRVVAACSILLCTGIASALADGSGIPGSDREIFVIVKGVATPFSMFGLLKHLQQIPGVTNANFDLLHGLADLKLKPGAQVSDDQIRQAIRSASYTPGDITRRPMSPAVTRQVQVDSGHPGAAP